jgi:hypothetical protein
MSDEHFTVDGTLIEAWASHKSFRPKDGTGKPPGPGGDVDFRGEKRKNQTHESAPKEEGSQMNRRSFLSNCTGAVGMIAGASSHSLLASNSTRKTSPDRDNRQKAKVSLSTDFGNPAHWDRVMDFAKTHEVSRLVYWGGDTADVFLYPRRPGLLPEQSRPGVERAREYFRSAAEKTARAGMEFWYVFQVLQLPVDSAQKSVLVRPPVLDYARQHLPELLNRYGEPDMAGADLYQFICDQLDELRTLAPQLTGIELWVMEGAGVEISSLEHQQLSLEDICSRIVDAVHSHLANTGIKLDVDLHTSGGDRVMRAGLLRAAQLHPDIIVSADNVMGDFNLFLPFHEDLVKASVTNPIAVHFDLNGEYWGRNFVPTSALDQYALHIEEALKLGAVYVDGRVGTIHDIWSPHANVLPSRRPLYPALAKVSSATPLPPDLDIPSTDTLGSFNAQFFCRRVKDPQCQPRDAVLEFVCREFGQNGKALVPIFVRLQRTTGKLFFADWNYYGAQSILPDSELMDLFYLSTQITLPAGTDFPTPEIRKVISTHRGYRYALAGWPIPVGHLCAGTSSIIFDKQEGLEEAQWMLGEVRKTAQNLGSTDRDFLVRLFEDLEYFARARCYLIEAQVHYYLLKQGKKLDAFSSHSRLAELRSSLQLVMHEWETRYPGSRYLVAERLKYWLEILSNE